MVECRSLAARLARREGVELADLVAFWPFR